MTTHSRLLAFVAASAVTFAPHVAPQPTLAQSATQTLNETTYIEIAERVLPSVVNITMESRAGDEDLSTQEEYLDFFEYFQNPQEAPRPDWNGTVSGSGVLIGRDGDRGYLATNNHVVERYNESLQIRLTFHLLDESGTEYNRTIEVAGDDVRIIGRDELSDLAVLEFVMPPSLEIEPLDFADSDKVKIGEHVLALGNPLDLNSTVTRGIVSAKSRYLSSAISLEKLIQTDAVIQPGNSGGPLVNLDGKIVGINNAIASRNGLWQGIGFAIPSNDAKRITSQLIEYGRVMRGFLGIEMRDARTRPDLVEMYEISEPEGVFVTRVVPDSPAEDAGLMPSDLVRAIDDTPVRSADEMLRVIANRDVNSDITIKVIRLDAELQPFEVTTIAKLTERPQEELLSQMNRQGQEGNPPSMLGEDLKVEEERYFGLDFERYFDREKMQTGLRVTNVVPGSRAAKAGLQVDDVIVRLNGERLASERDFAQAMERTLLGAHHFTVLRRGELEKIMLPTEEDER